MEDLRSSRRPARSGPCGGDVFGGASKHSVPFAAKSDDYAEIFGGIAASCSIPFLDLPPAAESCDAGGALDYSEIFGEISGGDFAVDYEELFKENKKKNGRTQKYAEFAQRAEVSEDASKDHGARLEKNKVPSSSDRTDDDAKQFNLSYHRAPRGSIDDVISGKAHITHLHAVREYMVDSSSQSVKTDGPPNIQPNDFIHNASDNGQLNDVEQEEISQPISLIDSTMSHGADSGTNQKDLGTKHTALEDELVNMKHHSRSSSNYSASSGDISYSDVAYVSISDINLRTQPSKVPPPSRAPPKLTSKQEDTKMKIYRNYRSEQEEGTPLKPAPSHQIHYRIGSSKNHGLQGVAKDVEMDASSAAAASAAAMKEAMELAQARLKSAKELMERKRDNLQSRKKLGRKEGVKYAEREEVKASDEGRASGVTAKKPLLKEEKGMRECALDDMLKVTKVGETTPDHEQKERCVVVGETHQVRQGNGFKSYQSCYSLEDVSGEWKIEDQFYELINNEKKFRAASKQEDIMKSKTTTILNEDKRNYSQKAEPNDELEITVKLNNVNETVTRDETDNDSKPCNSCKEEMRETPEKIPDICILKEDKLEGSSSCHQQHAIKGQVISGQEQKKPDGCQGIFYEENEMNVESFNDAFELKQIYQGYEQNGELGVKEHDDKEREWSKTYVTSGSHESEEKLKRFGKTDEQDVNKVQGETHMMEGEREGFTHEESRLDENSASLRENGNHESCNGENKDISSVTEHVETRKLIGAQGECTPVENDMRSEMAQDDYEDKNNPPTIGVRVTEKNVDSTKATCGTDVIAMERGEAQSELQQDEKKQNADLMPHAVENTVESGAFGDVHVEGGHGNLKKDNDVLGSEEVHSQFDAAQDHQKPVEKDIGDTQEELKSENKHAGSSAEEVCKKSQSSFYSATESFGTVVTENSKPDVLKGEKSESEKLKGERDHENEQARKIEEEKEREREREKDRLAAERATREALDRALAEARERAAERIAVERVTAEARQRALAESREKAEKASAEALERLLLEKKLKEAKLRAERAAVERATAEARERAVEKALAEKAAADARQRAERLSTISRDKNWKEMEAGDYMRASDKEDREIKLKPTSFDVRQDGRFKTEGSGGNFQRHADSSAHGEVESPLRCKARLERHQRTIERAAKALAEKNMRDILAQREQAERDRLAESLDAEIKRWSTGKEGNLRALLSTLQYILGSESGWQPIPLTEVITAAAVKKAYRKATLCVHPDKLQQRGASIQQKYICEKVFDLLKEAWNRFNSEER